VKSRLHRIFPIPQ